MSTVDNRIVEMTFDNGQFEKGVQTTIRSLGDLKKSLDLDKSAKSLDHLSKAGKDFDMGGLAKNVEFLANRFSNLGIVGMTALQNITNSAINLGKQFAKSLTIDQVTAGFDKYEQKTTAVQTIMSATGQSIGEVSNELERLNWFTDETSYNFVDMVSNIGKFTSQRIKLDTSVTAMQGIANWAALSGQNADAASRAMYNLSQAIGVGSVKLMDWKSIENANMATKEFKETAIETAKALGILDAAGKTKKGTLIDSANFSSTLSEEWFTKDVLLETLNKYGEYADEVFRIASEEGITAAEAMKKVSAETMKLGEKAFKAAQEAKTFSDAVNATKDAVSTGWMTTFEKIFGNYDEARVLWTDLANEMYDIFASGAEARNALLDEWRELGGREDLFKGLFDVLEGLKNIGTAVGDAFHDIFPETTVDNLMALTAGIKEFGANFKKVAYVLRGEWSDGSTREKVVTGKEPEEFLGELKKNRKGQSAEDVKKLQERLEELGYNVGTTGVDGIFGKRTEAALKKFQKDRELLEDGIYKEGDHASLMEALGFAGGEEVIIERVSESIHILGGSLNTVKSIVRGAFAVVGIATKVFGFLGNVVSHVATLLQPVGNAFLTIAAAVGDSLTALNAWLGESGIIDEKLEAIKTALAPFGVMIENASQALLNFFGLGSKADGNNEELMTFGKLWSNIINSIDKAGVFEKLSGAVDRLKAAFSGVLPVIKEYYERIKANLGEKFSGLIKQGFEKLPTIIEGISDFFVKVLDFISPVVQKIPVGLDVLKNFFSGLIPHIAAFASRVPAFLVKMKDFFLNLWDQVRSSEKLKSIWGNLKGFFGNFAKSFVEFIQLFWGAVKSFFDMDTSGSEGLGDELKQRMSVFSALGDWFKNEYAAAVETISPAIDGIKSLSKSFGINGIVGMLAAVLIGVGVVKAIKGLWNVVKTITTLTDALATLKHGPKKVTGIGSTILQIAGAIGLLVAAVVILGKMDAGQLIQGTVVVGAIVAALVFLGKSCKQLAGQDLAGPISQLSRSMLELGIGIIAIAAAIYLIGSIELGTLVKGLVGLIAVLGVMRVFIGSLSKLGTLEVKLSGLVKLSIAVGLLAGIARLIGGMNQDRFYRGLIRTAAIMTMLRVFTKSISKVSAGNIKFSGLVRTTIAVGLLAVIARLIGGMNANLFWSGVINLIGVMGLLAILTKVMGTVKMETKGLIGTVLVLGMLAGVVKIIGGLPIGDALGGLLGLSALMLGLSVLFRSMSKIKLGSVAKSLLALAGLMGIVWLFGQSLAGIKDINTDKLAAFAGGLSAIMLSFGAFTLVAGAVGIAGIGAALLGLVGLVAAISLVIAAFAGLSKIPGFNDFMNSGAAKIGEMIGNFVGGMKAGEMSQLTKGLSSFDGFHADTSGIENAMAAASMIDQFAKGLPQRDAGQKILDFIVGSNLKSFSNDLPFLASGLSSFVTTMDGVEIAEGLDEKTAAAIAIAEQISTFSSGLDNLTIGESLMLICGGNSPLKQFAEDMAPFADGFNAFAIQMGRLIPVDGLAENTASAVGIAQSIANIGNSLKDPTLGETITLLCTGTSPFGRFTEDMVNFADGFNAYSAQMDGLAVVSGLEQKTASAVSIAKSIAGITTALKEPTVAEGIAMLIGQGSPLENFSGTMPQFAEGFSGFADEMSRVEAPSGWEEKSKKAIGIAKGIADLAGSLKDRTFEESFSLLIGQDSPLEKFAGDIPKFATGFNKFAKEMAKIEDPGDWEGKSAVAISVAQGIASFTEGLPELKLEDAILTNWFGADSAFSTFVNNMTTFGPAMTSYADVMDSLASTTVVEDTGAALAVATSLADFVDHLSTLTLDDNTHFFKIFGGGTTSNDTLLGQMKAMGDAMPILQGSISGLGQSTLVDDFAAAKAVLTSMTNFLAWLASEEVSFGKWEAFQDSNAQILFRDLDGMSDAIAHFATQTKGVDLSSFTAIIDTFSTMATALSTVAGTTIGESITAFTGGIREIAALLTGDGAEPIDPDAFLSGLDAEAIAAKVTAAATTIATATTAASEQLSGATSSFNAAGSEIATALASGVSTEPGTSAMESACSAMVSKATAFISKFYTVGFNIASGMARGISSGASLAVAAAIKLASGALSAAKEALDVNSPSRKFDQVGRWSGEGLANGLTAMGGAVSKAGTGLGSAALDSTSSVLSSLSDLLLMDLDSDPVIRPVVDLSNVEAGARNINGMFSGQRSVSLARSSELASSVRMPSKSDVGQNGNVSTESQRQAPSADGVLLTGNTFSIRSDNDIHLLAHELAALTKSGQRAMGAPLS